MLSLLIFATKRKLQLHQVGENGPFQLLNAMFKDVDIDDCQVLKYQPSVTSRLILEYLIIINRIEWRNITLDVIDG